MSAKAITPWNIRLDERLREGAARYSTSTTCDADPHDLGIELANECADAAGWAWVLFVRTITVPEPARGHLAERLSRLAVLALRLHTAVRTARDAVDRHCAGLHRVYEPRLAGPFPPRSGTPPTWQVLSQWCQSAVLDMTVDGDVAVDEQARRVFAARVGRRTQKGRETYDNRSFYRRPSELARELGDEIVSIAGWAAVLNARLDGAPGPRPALEALVRGARHAYLRSMSLALVAAEGDDSEPPPEGLVAPTAGGWVASQIRPHARRLSLVEADHGGE